MIRKLSIQSLTFSSVLALAAASGAAWAADSTQQQSMAGSSDGQTTQQDASSPSTASSSDTSTTTTTTTGGDTDDQAASSSDEVQQSAAASSSTATGTAVGDDSRSRTGAGTETPAAIDSQQSASADATQQTPAVEPVQNGDELAELSGKTVVNMQGEEIGKIDSIVRDRTDQSLKAVIQSGGFFGIGGEKVAVSADDLQVQGDDQVQLNTPMTKEELQQTASAYDEQNYEPLGDSQQARGDQADPLPAGSSQRG